MSRSHYTAKKTTLLFLFEIEMYPHPKVLDVLGCGGIQDSYGLVSLLINLAFELGNLHKHVQSVVV